MTFDVIGQPATKGSSKAFPYRKAGGGLGVRLTADNPTLRAWETRVRAEAVVALQRCGESLIARPTSVRLAAVFRLPRPRKYSTLPYEARRKHAPAHTTRPDLDKLARALGDALRGAAYEDDAQVELVHVEKRYAKIGEQWGVEVTVLSGPNAAKTLARGAKGTAYGAQENIEADHRQGAQDRAQDRDVGRRP